MKLGVRQGEHMFALGADGRVRRRGALRGLRTAVGVRPTWRRALQGQALRQGRQEAVLEPARSPGHPGDPGRQGRHRRSGARRNKDRPRLEWRRLTDAGHGRHDGSLDGPGLCTQSGGNTGVELDITGPGFESDGVAVAAGGGGAPLRRTRCAVAAGVGARRARSRGARRTPPRSPSPPGQEAQSRRSPGPPRAACPSRRRGWR
jgi:hypothetical protein